MCDRTGAMVMPFIKGVDMEANAACYRNEIFDDVEFLDAKNGQKTLRIGGRFMHSAYDPKAEADRWAKLQVEGKENPEKSMWVVLGCGLGYQIQALVDNGVRNIIVFEPEPLLTKYREQTFIRDRLDEQVQVLVTSDRSELREAFRARFPAAQGTRISIIPSYEKVFGDLLHDIRDELTGFVQEFRVSRYTYISAARSWLMLTVQNLPAMVRLQSVGVLKSKARGWPAVIVSAGPSLDKNIHQLAKVQDQFLILCPSQTLKAAKAAGIKPDLVLVADSHNLSYHFDGCGPGDFSNLLIAAKCHPAVSKVPSGRTMFYYLPPNPLAEQIYDWRGDGAGAALPTGASVSNIAMQLAISMEADPVILIGQDLAFSGDKMYASGAADGGGRLDFSDDGTVSMKKFKTKRAIADEHNKQQVMHNLTSYREIHWVRGQDGTRLMTSVDMRSMLAKFERDAAEITSTGRRLINATEGGAFIRGMEHMTFTQAVEQAGASAVVDLESRLAADVVGADQIERVERELRKKRQVLRQLHTSAKHCLDIAKRCIRASRPDVTGLNKLARMEKKLNKLLAKAPSINAMVQDALVKYRTMGDPRDDDLGTNLKRANVLYTAVMDASEELNLALADMLEKGDG